MKVFENSGFSDRPYTVEEALNLIIEADPHSGGEFEQLRYKLDNLTKLVVRFLSSNVTTVDQLNSLAGYTRFKAAQLRTIIAGSRTIEVTASNMTILQSAIRDCGWEISAVLSGGAEGADRLGELWAICNGVKLERYPADWNLLGKKAGMVRNRKMSENAEALIALWDGKSKGTENMIKTATKAGLQVYVKRVNDLEIED